MGTAFDPKRVAEVQLPGPRSPHLLVRGNMPLTDGYFAYQGIEDALDMIFQSDRFVSVSLIDNTGERDSWSEELDAFGVLPEHFPAENWPPYLRQPAWNPEILQGTGILRYGDLPFTRTRANLLWWPFEGMSEQDEDNAKVFLHAPGWDFAGLVDHLYGIYLDEHQPSTVIYMHCMLGADRTGALHAGLLIRAGLNADEALQVASQATEAGAPSMNYQRLVHAYAKEPRVE